MNRSDPTEARARELAIQAGVNPDSRVHKQGEREGGRGMPAWCDFRDAARKSLRAEQTAPTIEGTAGPVQDAQYRDAPLSVFGDHEEQTLKQMRNCLSVGNAVAGVLCADGHFGYAQSVGGVVAYEGQVSISGVGYDIGCGNMAVRLDTMYDDIAHRAPAILADIRKHISFGIGRVNEERAEHALFDDGDAWRASGMEDYRQKARGQLGTVGSGNHYVDLFRAEDGHVWIGVHFGSRGLGHTTATRYLKLAGGKDGMNVPPAVVNDTSPLGEAYLAGMELAGRYAYAGREWVVERVRAMLGGTILHSVHNHHNYAWKEVHGGRNLWVVRKGATPAFPGQQGFVGGSMGDDAVILEGVEGAKAASALYSTVHGAGRICGRMEAKRRFVRAEMDAWLKEKGVLLAGGDLDESPMSYRRLPEVLAHHEGTVRILQRLRPFAVAMAGDEKDPFKD